MLDMNFIRENPDKVRWMLEARGMEVDLEGLLEWDRKFREATTEVNELRHRRNVLAETIPRAEDPQEKRKLIEESREVNRRIKELEEVIAAYVDTHSSIKAMVERIMTIPGISLVTAATIVAEVGDFTRFPDKKQISGWAGVVPRTRESAGVQRGYGITKRGSPYLRHALHEVANVIILRKEPKELYAFYWRVRRRSGKYKAITALAHKVLIVLWGMMTTGSNLEMDSNMRRLYNRKLKRFNNMAELGKRVLLEVT